MESASSAAAAATAPCTDGAVTTSATTTATEWDGDELREILSVDRTPAWLENARQREFVRKHPDIARGLRLYALANAEVDWDVLDSLEDELYAFAHEQGRAPPEKLYTRTHPELLEQSALVRQLTDEVAQLEAKLADARTHLADAEQRLRAGVDAIAVACYKQTRAEVYTAIVAERPELNDSSLAKPVLFLEFFNPEHHSFNAISLCGCRASIVLAGEIETQTARGLLIARRPEICAAAACNSHRCIHAVCAGELCKMLRDLLRDKKVAVPGIHRCDVSRQTL